MVSTDNGQPTEDRSIGELVSDASAQLSRLVREEMRLAAAELQQKGKRVGAGAGLLGAAGLLAWFGVATVVACVVLALALVMPAWLAALVVAVALLLAAGVLALLGKRQVQRALPPVPEQTLASVEQDVQAVKEGLHR